MVRRRKKRRIRGEEISGRRGGRPKHDSPALQDYKCLMSFTTLHLNTSVLRYCWRCEWKALGWHHPPDRRRMRQKKSHKNPKEIQISPWTASHLRRFTTANPFDSLTCHHLYHSRFSFPPPALVLNLLKFFFVAASKLPIRFFASFLLSLFYYCAKSKSSQPTRRRRVSRCALFWWR